MKIKCAYSGVSFTCSAFPGFVDQNYVHPAHFLPFAKLSAVAENVITSPSKHSQDEQVILLSSMLYQTGLVHYECPISAGGDETIKNVLNNLEYAYRLAQVIITVHKKEIFPQYLITKETASLGNLQEILNSWRDTLIAYDKGYTPISKEQKIARLQTKILSLQKSGKNPIKQLADWAAEVGNFPNWKTKHPVTEQEISCRDYWIEILCSLLGVGYSILEYPLVDVEDLQEHICSEIPVGSSFSHLLFDAIEEVISTRRGYNASHLNVLTPKGLVRLAMEQETAEDNAKYEAALAALPTAKPNPADFADQKAFAKAMMVWRLRNG